MKKSDLKDWNDTELLENFKNTGDNEYFQEFFGRYKSKIQGACLSFFRRNRSLAEDAMQDTFLKALQGARHDTIQNIRAWLLRIAKNSCIDIHRKERAAIMESHSESDAVLTAASVKQQTQQNGMRAQELIQKINNLGDKQRICLKLYLEGHTYREISKMTRYSEKEIKSAIQTGKENLRKSFDE